MAIYDGIVPPEAPPDEPAGKGSAEVRRTDSTFDRRSFESFVILLRDSLASPAALGFRIGSRSSVVGTLDSRELKEVEGLCIYTLENGGMVVLDMVPHRTSDGVPSPSAGLRQLQFFAGMPVRNAAGQPEFVLAVVDVRPRTLDAREARILLGLAQLAERVLGEDRAPASTEPRRCPLTGLLSQSHALKRLDRILGDAREAETEVALVIADIADFNAINSAFGRPEGDRILRAAAQRLVRLAPSNALVFRLQGDQFGIVVPVRERATDVESLLSALTHGFVDPVYTGSHEVTLHLVYGTALFPYRAKTASELVDRAILALRRAQEQRSVAEVFTTELEEKLVREVAVEQRLRTALLERTLTVEYQPKVRLATGAICSVEALARWSDEQLGRISPAEFIPAAERAGLIIDLGRQVLETSLRDVRVLRELNRGLTVSVNVAAAQLQKHDFVEVVLEALRVADVPPSALELEVVETSLIENIDRAASIIEQLKSRGVSFSIDDFGTGYSSLAYLRRLPVHTLKIDRGFVSDLTHSPRDAALLKSIISMAHVLDFEVVAEGVETPVQAEMLRKLGCDAGQGWHFARPANIDAIRAQLEEAARGASPDGPNPSI